MLDDKDATQSSAIMRSFLTMCICFSLNHACVTTVLGLASSVLGETLSGNSSGTLYVFYTLTALCGATFVVGKLGTKGSLVAGCALYCFYVAIFIVIHLLGEGAPDSIKYPVALGGSAIGGIAAGFLWTAQGGYFAVACDLLVVANNPAGSLTEEDLEAAKQAVSSQLASYFASIYLVGEVGLKLLATLVMSKVSDTASFMLFTAVALTSALGMTTISNFPAVDINMLLLGAQPKTPEATLKPLESSTTDKLTRALALLARSGKLWLLLPQNAAFGFTSAFLNQYVNAEVVKPFLGKSNVPLIGAVASFSAAVSSLGFNLVTQHAASKVPVMLFGAACFIAFSTVFVVLEPASLYPCPHVHHLRLRAGYLRKHEQSYFRGFLPG